MAPLLKNSIYHLSHEMHPLKPIDSVEEFLCNGCKTLGTGKRYRCNGCDFDLHDYCGTCPRLLSSFLHRHSLTLVIPKPRQINRICDVCRDPVEGMFYRCKECEFDVHPVCTQLPEKLNHVLHPTHPLTLQSSNSVPNFCTVCRNSCKGWHYNCGVCNVYIHLGCVLAPAAPCPQMSQRMPYQSAIYHGPGYPIFGNYYTNYGSGPNAYHDMHPQQGPYLYPPQQNYHVGGSSSNNGTGQLIGKSMFSLVGQLGFGVISNMVFGVDVPSLFAG